MYSLSVAFGTDPDLTMDQVKRASREMFGNQGALLVDAKLKTVFVGAFLDGRGQRPMRDGHPITPDHRPYKVYGSGPTWAEAIRRAVLAIQRETTIVRLE